MFDYELEGREDPVGLLNFLLMYPPTNKFISQVLSINLFRDWPQANPFNTLSESQTLAKRTGREATPPVGFLKTCWVTLGDLFYLRPR